MKKRRVLALVLSLFFIVSLFIGGCAPAKKPAPTPAPVPAPSKKMTTPSTDRTRATKIAQACDSVSGVKKSTVVVSGNTCYVGLDLAANIEKSKTDRVERDCLDKAKATEPSIKTVYVTSDMDTVTRLKKVYQGVARGTPVSSFTNELGEIGRRITPKVKG
ncbi:YhcN/YlaJ family sporulation lipoprotein [Candidatus Formimonas warabiya]|uniref:YhcN/YlaJ family sporulation lipoprotein n=1 Tax=Formimonas warabiya TaxID=1761012 RepID=A0A3G1KRR5_FORW1|nr:YhcN/YlaJ family sporulation lipoprotein [Candidatus Formimonas warabiya]ATW25136.1 hypothetical protein DCMF_10475 [Candidatus Formimonas warabiya]